MTNDLLLHPKTRHAVELYLAKPFSFLIIEGPAGAGKDRLIDEISKSLLGNDLEKSTGYTEILRKKDKKDIDIEQVRQVISKLALKPTKTGGISRVISIKKAEQLNKQTQNLLLKTLEESPESTVFIFGVSHIDSLLPTIISRAQIIKVYPVTIDDSLAYFKLHQMQEIVSAHSLSDGNAGMMSKIVSGSLDNKTSIELAKKFLKSTQYERITSKEFSSLSKDQLAELLDSLSRIAKALTIIATQKENIKDIKRLNSTRTLLAKLNEGLEQNANAKLTYLSLVQKINI